MVNDCTNRFADEPATCVESAFSVGGVSVGLSGSRNADVELVSALVPFQIETECAEIEMEVGRKDEIRECAEDKVFDSGAVWRLYEHGSELRFDFTAPIFGRSPYKRLLVDPEFCHATLQINERFFADSHLAPLDYPLDELLITHRLTQIPAIELHGCGIISPRGVGNLFVGHSGSGKTTTTRLWIAHERVDVLSDDRIIVRKRDEQMVMYGTPWHGEAAFASPASWPLKRIFVLEQGLGNRLFRLTPPQAIGELFARSFVPLYNPKYVDAGLSFLEALTHSVPCYRYVFEPNQGAVERIRNFSD